MASGLECSSFIYLFSQQLKQICERQTTQHMMSDNYFFFASLPLEIVFQNPRLQHFRTIPRPHGGKKYPSTQCEEIKASKA